MSKILVIGNATVDQVMQLAHYPQQNEEMRATGKYIVIGGNACNTAQILAQLDHQVHFMSSLGDDSEAQFLRETLSRKKIDTRQCVVMAGHRTPYSSIWLNQQNGSRTITHFRDLPELPLEDLQSIKLSEYDWIHFEGRNVDTLKTFLNKNSAALARTSCVISLEIEKPRHEIESLLADINVAIVSSHYLRAKKLKVEKCIQQLQAINPSLKLACTLGESGVLGRDESGNIYPVAAIAIDDVIDTIGAGDCFIAGLIDALVQGDTFEASLHAANQLAAFKIQHMGMNIEGYENCNL